MKKFIFLLIWVVGCLLLSACSENSVTVEKEEDTETNPSVNLVSEEPVTIVVGTTSGASITDSDFEKIFVDPVAKEHPNITLELVRQGGEGIAGWITNNQVPDILLHSNGWMNELHLYDLMTDIMPYVKKSDIDLNRFDKDALESVQVASDEGTLVGLPYAHNFNALYYNQDIFDKFGIGYPEDGLTWDEVITLSTTLSRFEDGTQYMGLHPETVVRPSYSLSLNVVNPDSNKARMNEEGWERAFQLALKIVEVPGNWDGLSGASEFWSKQNIAMLSTINRLDLLHTAAVEQGFTNWDVAQYPSFPDLPDTYSMVDSHVMVLSKISEAKEQAVQVMNVVTSDEVQLMISRAARMPVLSNPQLMEEFGKDFSSLEGKSIQSIFKSKPAVPAKFSPYERMGRPLLQESFVRLVQGEIDLNTALREAEENINAMLEEQAKSQ